MDTEPHALDADFISAISVGTFLLVGGCVGNAMTVHHIRNHPDLHAPTFVLIACLACTDIVALVFRYLIFTYDLYMIYLPSRAEVTTALLICGLTSLHCSNLHIVLLARLRYKLIVFPLQTVNISLGTIYRSSAIAWIISLIVALAIELPMTVNSIEVNIQYIISVGNGFYLLFSTLIPILWFHFHKIRALKSSQQSVPTRGNDVTGKMSLMVSLILTFQVVAIVPLVTINFCANVIDINKHLMNILGNISHCTLMLNHGINPVLFFYFSKFRRSTISEV